MSSFTADERRTLARALADDADESLECPACGGGLRRQRIPRPEEVAYVRRRVLLVCSDCKRSGAVDLPNR